jgi:hypothetical protein
VVLAAKNSPPRLCASAGKLRFAVKKIPSRSAKNVFYCALLSREFQDLKGEKRRFSKMAIDSGP